DALTTNTPSAAVVFRVQIGANGLTAIIEVLFLLSLSLGAFLYLHLLSWIVLRGVVFLVLGSPELFGFADSQAVASITSWLTGLESGTHPDDLNRNYSGLLGIGWRMLAMMSASWLLVFVQLFLVWVLGIVRRLRIGPPRAPNLIIP